ncbi:MAG: hypothetical protein NXI13_00810 [Proteobacteria bacterium]|nr:hypothetical protein [Pseudomonadota bacterium]
MHSWLNRRSVLDLILALVSIAYPFLVYFGLTRFSPWTVGIFLLVFLIARVVLKRGKTAVGPPGKVFVLIILAIALLMFVDQILAIKAYPVMISLSMAVIFGYSLFNPPSIIEKIARLREPNLDQTGVVYTRKVTVAWTLFFIGNATISIWTALYASIETWTVYNGFISYILIGLMFAIELTVRHFVRRRKAP